MGVNPLTATFYHDGRTLNAILQAKSCTFEAQAAITQLSKMKIDNLALEKSTVRRTAISEVSGLKRLKERGSVHKERGYFI